jgi:hypothetical protein
MILPSFEVEGVNYFLSDDDTRGYMPSCNKSCLRMTDEISEMILYSISNRFGNKFVNNIT